VIPTRALVLAGALAALPATVSAQGQGVPTEEPLTLDVMTFNIRTSAGRDGDNGWRYRRELVADAIGRFNPDVVGLQEALIEQIVYLEDALPQYRWIGVDRGLNGGVGLSEATPIFYRHDELVPIEFGTFWLGDAPDGRSIRRGGSRIVTWARLHHLATRRQVWVYNTHFTLREGERQLESAARINEHVAGLPPGSAVVVMGDFNAAAEYSATWRTATSQGLHDAWTIAAERHGPAVTSNGFGPPPEGWEARIDWILVGGPVEVPSIATVLHSVDGQYPSDHYPVLATLRLPPG
jgi:endonuclease/exonuclease/phosphatase family metal-dependent hydrolase